MSIDLLTVFIVTLGTFLGVMILLYIFLKFGGIGLVGLEYNKPYHRSILSSAGIVVVGIIVIIYVLFSFIEHSFFWSLITISIVTLLGALLGIFDDFYNVHIWKKVPLMLLPPVPLAIVSLYHPLWENTSILWINFGVLFWLFIVPVVYMGFSNGLNIIAGYDGMEAGIVLLISALFTIIGVIEGNALVVILSLTIFSAFLAFELYNWYPSKLLLGNVGSFPIGGLLGLIPLIGHFEIILPIVFLPHLVEFAFKIKYKGHTSVFGVVDKNGVIHNKDGIKSVLHWLISWGNMTEKKITLAMLGIETALCVIAFFVWYLGEFFIT